MTYRVHNYQNRKPNYRKTSNSAEFEVITVILKGVWWLLSLPFRLFLKKRNPGQLQKHENISLDRQFVAQKWQEIEQLMQMGSPSNFQRAVLEADKLLDHLLKGHRAPGLTMGDRLKASKNKFSVEGYDAAWQAHKVRNEIVHNTQYDLTDFMTRNALENYKKAIGELI